MPLLFSLETLAALCFGLAVLHTFLVKRIQHLALKYVPGSLGENIYHFLGEVEVVFGLWAGIFLLAAVLCCGKNTALAYVTGLRFTEPLFVAVVMVVSATKPILELARRCIEKIASFLPFSPGVSLYMTILIMGPLLGSFITEPAAITVTALILLKMVYNQPLSLRLKYATLGLLFVNISIGGTLTHFAAPPVVMVASTWGWDSAFVFMNLGWKAIVAILLSTSALTFWFRHELKTLSADGGSFDAQNPVWVSGVHLLFLAAVVYTSHYPIAFVMVFLVFLGFATATKEYQNELKLKEGLLVGFFLGGLVILGGLQQWWLGPILEGLSSFYVFVGAIGLTAVVDNAALTYLGSHIPNLSDAAKLALVSGSVVGGGLTVIANAPNPAGFGILKEAFGEEGISPLGLFLGALFPTLVAALCFYL